MRRPKGVRDRAPTNSRDFTEHFRDPADHYALPLQPDETVPRDAKLRTRTGLASPQTQQNPIRHLATPAGFCGSPQASCVSATRTRARRDIVNPYGVETKPNLSRGLEEKIIVIGKVLSMLSSGPLGKTSEILGRAGKEEE